MEFKCALITGGGGGIGKTLAKYFISQGKKVIIAGRTESNLQNARKEIGAAAYYVLDTGVVSEIPAFVRRVTSEHPDLDCLVNNAGVQRPLSVIEMAPDEFLDKADQEININIRGPLHLALRFLSHFNEKPHALIINVSSILEFAPFSLINPVYNGTKALVHAWSINLRYSKEIRYMRTQYMLFSTLLLHRAQLEGTGVKVVEMVPPTVETALPRERKNPDDNKKSSNPNSLSLDEFISEVSKGLESGDETVAAGMAVNLVEQWDETLGNAFRKLKN
ncbi:NAD(P)-binding protein [Xylaria sp. FL1042]|nr:NAD(P)-binding protein [Xylaria sp. FL1042]